MKTPYYLLFAFFFLTSCASNTINMDRQKEIASDTQRIGEEYYNAGNDTAALKNLLEAYKTIPDNPYLNNSLGLVYLAKDRYGLGEKHFKRALELKADYIDAKNNLGAAYFKQEKWDLAIQCFEEVSQNLLYPTPEIPLSNLGLAYFHQKLYRKAKMYFDRSLEIRPNFLIAVHGIASIYLETGNPTLAVEYLQHALEKDPGAAILHSDLAKAYEALHDVANARRSWKLVLKLVPETSSLAVEAQKRLYSLD